MQSNIIYLMAYIPISRLRLPLCTYINHHQFLLFFLLFLTVTEKNPIHKLHYQFLLFSFSDSHSNPIGQLTLWSFIYPISFINAFLATVNIIQKAHNLSLFLFGCQSSTSVEFKKDNISIFYDIVSTLLTIFACSLCSKECVHKLCGYMDSYHYNTIARRALMNQKAWLKEPAKWTAPLSKGCSMALRSQSSRK